jgi:hypothetical protein
LIESAVEFYAYASTLGLDLSDKRIGFSVPFIIYVDIRVGHSLERKVSLGELTRSKAIASIEKITKSPPFIIKHSFDPVWKACPPETFLCSPVWSTRSQHDESYIHENLVVLPLPFLLCFPCSCRKCFLWFIDLFLLNSTRIFYNEGHSFAKFLLLNTTVPFERLVLPVVLLLEMAPFALRTINVQVADVSIMNPS